MFARLPIVFGFLFAAFAALPAHAEPVSLLHFRPATGVLGDTIPFYWRGTYHVFYLKGQRWGHLASKDLVHWKELPDALEKGEGETAPDGEACWTGSIVEHDGLFHLFYTGKNSRDPKGDQKVMHAMSSDLVTWTKHPDWTFYADGTIYWSKPVNGTIDDKLLYHHQAFRDPEVFWNAKDKRWWLLLHAALADGSSPAFARYASDDLVHWTPCPPLMVCGKNLSCDCPDIFPAGAKWYIIAADRHYTFADAAEGPYRPEMTPYDCGELFVPKTLFDGKRYLFAGWIADREGLKDSGKGVWGGTMSMMREIYPDAQGRLCQRPPKEIVKAYRRRVNDVPKTLSSGESVALPRDCMVHFQLKAEAPNAEVRIAFRAQSGDRDAGYRLTFPFTSKETRLSDRHRDYARVCEVDPARPVDVRVFLADTLIECFVNDAYCFAMHAYDYREGGMRFDVISGDASLSKLSVRQLK